LHRWVPEDFRRFDDEVIRANEPPGLLERALEERHLRLALHDSLRAHHSRR
jgi:hypothetical protein